MAGNSVKDYLRGLYGGTAQSFYEGGLDPWSKRKRGLQQEQQEFDNYLNSGNYTVENNATQRSSASKRVEDLGNEMKNYSKSSDEYRTLEAYKNYYEQTLPTFDRLDVGLNANNYISSDAWHSEEDYNAQRTSLQNSIDSIQAEMDAIGDEESDDYKQLATYRDWYQKIMDGGEDGFGLAQREQHDRQFKDLDEYTQYQRAQDYGNNVQLKKTLEDVSGQFDTAKAEFKQAQIDYNLGKIGYKDLALADQKMKALEEQKNQLSDDLTSLEKIQWGTIYNNYVDQYGEDADFRPIVNSLIEDREKAKRLYGENSAEYEKIDRTIKVLAGDNEESLNDDRLVTDATLYGQSVLRDIDREDLQTQIDEIDAKLKELGAEQTTGMGWLATLGNAAQASEAAKSGQIDQYQAATQRIQDQNNDEVKELRAQRLNLQRLLNSSESIQKRETTKTELPKVEGYDQLVEAGKNSVQKVQNANNKEVYAYTLPGYDENAEDSERAKYSRLLDDFEAIADKEEYQWLSDMIYAAVGAEVEGKDIGYTVQDLMDTYGGLISQVKGLEQAQRVHDIDSDFVRWNAQVLGVGTQAGLNQFVTGVQQAFSTDYIEPNSTAIMGQKVREDIGEQYGGKKFFQNSGTGGATLSQLAFDTTQTTANMLPMILASSLITGGLGAAGVAAGTAAKVGEIAGATLMGVSSAGNSYQQALAEGWDKRDARLFSTIMGTAEGGLQYLIGGISKLGGGNGLEEAALNAAKGINNGVVRWMAETGTHIASEVNEELLQNRIERVLTNYLFNGGEDSIKECLTWNDDDWYTVMVTALSTGALEGPGSAMNLTRNTRLGKQLTGEVSAMSEKEAAKIQGKIESKQALTQREANKKVLSRIGEAMKGDSALNYTLLAIGENMMYADGEAHELASRMASGKAAKSAANYGELYSLILNEFEDRNGADGYDDAMMAVIGGAIAYHKGNAAEDNVKAKQEQVAKIREANPGVKVLDENSAALKNLGAPDSSLSEYSVLVNKMLSGTRLTEAETAKLSDGSMAAKAARVYIGQQLGLDLNANTTAEVTKATLDAATTEMQSAKKQQEEMRKMSVVQAAMNAADRAAVNRATANTEIGKAKWSSENQAWEGGSVVDRATDRGQSYSGWKSNLTATQEQVKASDARAAQKADSELAAAQAELDWIKRASFKELAQRDFSAFGKYSESVGALEDLQKQLSALNDAADRINANKFPTREQRDQLADIRQQQAAIKQQMNSVGSSIEAGLLEEAKAAQTKSSNAIKPKAEAAQNSSDSVPDIITVPGMGERSRAQFVQDYMARNPGATLEQANARFDQFAEQTGAVKKGNAEKRKPERAKLTGKVEYWRGGVLEGTNYDQVSEAEARDLLGEANMAFLEKVLTKIANVTLIKSRLENGEYVGANGIFYRDGRIYLDVNAEMDFGERGIVLAAAHELTHFIAEYNSPAFLKLKDFVLNELKNKGMPLDERIKDQQARYKATTGKELSREKAEEEVVADACEMMLTDADAIKRFAAENPTEAKTILDWLTDFFNQIADAFRDLVAVHPEAKALQEQTNQIRERWLNALVEADANAAKASIDKLSEGGQKIVESLGQDATIQVDANGDMTLAQSEDGKTLAFSMKTYKDSGKQKLIQALKENGHTQEEIDAVVENIEATGEFLLKLAQQFSDSHGYNNLMNNLWAEITTNVKTGKQVISTLVNNGDYPVNMDLQLICKKRVAYMRMLTRLIDDGVFEKVDFKGSAIADLNAVLRDGGFETACLGCFVESRRLQLQAWAETIVEEWNAAVDKRNPLAGYFDFAKGGKPMSDMEIAGLITELENAGKKNNKGNLNLGKGAVAEKMGRLLDKVPSLVQHLTVADLLTPQGMSTLRSYDQNLFSLVKQRYGAASPKIVQDFNAYNSEIADLSFKFIKDLIGESVKGSGQYISQAKKELKQRIGESKAAYNRRVETEAMRRYLYDIGGARIQSFSDFMIENVFDYLQIVADLSAREFPLHGYSKEAIFLRLFGMTGGKFNGSLIAHVEGKMGKEYAGLLPAEEAKDGRGILVEVDGEKYAICFDDYARHVATGSFIQSIGMKDIIALQLDPRYSKNVGSITIGVSDKQILAMLDSPYFRMVIPYHASGMIPEFAKLVGVNSYNDYTDYQTTKVNKCFDVDGNPVEGFWKADGKKIEIDTHYDFNEAVQRLGDAKAAANEYLEWCKQRHPVYDGKKIVGYATFTAKFSDSPYGTDFTKHENYYKLLEDFNSYDSIGEASALQGAVTMTLPSEATRLTAEQMAEYKQALRDTGLFTEKDIERYAEKADMTFQELIAEEVGNRAEYESRQAKVWDETVDKAEKMLLEKYRRTSAAKTEMRDNEPMMSSRSAKNSEDEIKSLFDRDDLGLVDFEEKVDRWVADIPVGSVVEWGLPNNRRIATKKADGSFSVTAPDGNRNSVRATELREWLMNNVSHDLWAHDWDEVGVKVRDAGPSFSLRNGEEATVYIKDGHRADGSTVDFINEILDGRKLGETRNHNRMTYGKWVGIGKDGQVLGRVKFGKPYQISRNSPEYANAMIEGTEYDLKDGETKWYYPVVEKEDFRNNPKPITRNGNYGVYQVDGKSVTPEEAQASFSSRDAQYNDWAPEFYSKMANTIDEWTNGKGQPLGAKMAANQVVGWLKGKGVKSEEIKWSGIIPYLEGKKTVTKEELQRVMAENEIKIETKVLESGAPLWRTTIGWLERNLTKENLLASAIDKFKYNAKRDNYEYWVYDENGNLKPGMVELVDRPNGKIAAVNGYTGEILYEAERVYGEAEDDATKWGRFALPGGSNYREILFKQPGLVYTNRAMQTHWGDEKGVLAHTRVQDFDNEGERILFVEELQSDLHNAGTQEGFAEINLEKYDQKEIEEFRNLIAKSEVEFLLYSESQRLKDLESKLLPKDENYDTLNTDREITWREARFQMSELLNRIEEKATSNRDLIRYANAKSLMQWILGETEGPLSRTRLINEAFTEEEASSMQQKATETVTPFVTEEDKEAVRDYDRAYKAFRKVRDKMDQERRDLLGLSTPNVPFAGSADTYHEYVMKHLLRMAAEGGYDAIAWTSSDIQIDRWRNAKQLGYGVFKDLYDKKLVQFMNKYGKQWGAKVGSTVLENDEEVWSVPITEEMKRSVLETGQPLFSSRDTNAPENSNPYPDKTLQHDILEHVRKGDLAQWLNEQKNAYDEALENSKERPPVIPAKGFVPRVTEKEKQAIDNRNRALIQQKGAMRPSEKAANDFRMAKEDEKGNRFHRFLQNVITAKQTTPAHDQAKKFAFTDVAGTYVPDSNKADLKWAKDVIHEDGRESAIKQFNRAAIAMDNSQHNITKNLALGQQLLIETSRDGDMQGFLDVLSSLTLLSSQAGKSLQAFRMLKQSGPIGELYYVEKAVKQLNERNAAKIQAGKMDAITIPEDFANAVLTAATEEEQDKAVDNLIAEIGKQVPVTLMDKWNAWRYLAMLGNARTHIRNLVGNAVFVPLRFAKDLMAAGGEFVLTKTGLMNEQDRRKALFVSKELKDFAKQDALAMQKELQGNGKYNPMREILDARRVLPGFLETISRKNGQALEYEDWLFLSPAYQNALTQALTHTGYSIEEMLDGSNQDAVKALNRARVLAVEEAQKATYRDFNAAASMLNRIKRMETGKASDKALGVLLEGILPFTKTPINILRRGVEYSPIGIASSIFEAAAKVKSGEFDMAEFIDHLSAGLTGSAVVVLGYLLSSLGYLRSKKDDKEEEFEKMQGYQDYSLQIGGVSATIDWAAPTALPLFTGAAIKDLMNGEDLEWKDAWDAMMMIAEPMMSLSMLDGLNNVLSSASYADDSQKLATVASSAFTSYIGQAFPTIAGQLARSIDGTRRATYVDKNSQVPSAIQRFVQSSVQSKTPVWESQKIPYIDQWGREDTVNSKALGALENFLSPSYINLVHTTDVDEALRELYDSTKDSGVLPARIQNRVVKVNGEERYLTADQFVDISRYAGTTKYTMLTQLFSDPRYMQLTDEQKAKAVSKVYDYANTTGKYYVWNDYNLHGQGKWMEEMYDMPTEIQRFNRFWEYLESYLKLD